MPPGYATDTITSTSNTLQLGISEKLGVFLEYMATLIGAIVIAFTYSWELTLVTCSALFFILITVSVLLPLIVAANGRLTKVRLATSYSSIQGLLTLPLSERREGDGRSQRDAGEYPYDCGLRRRV
jgi:ATP-binding cassette, subfamily B (MDR/TAP), member 1